MFIKKSQYLALKDHLDELVNKNTELEKKLKQKFIDNLVELLDSEEYKYAILVKGYAPIVYNDGRIEKGVRSIEFEAHCDDIPKIMIEK